jgi:cysteine synthase
VTILCDSGSRYLGRLYNPGFLLQRKLPVAEWIMA